MFALVAGGYRKFLLLSVLVLTLAAGCAITPGEIAVPYPDISSLPEPTGKPVFLKKVKDIRTNVDTSVLGNVIGMKRLGGTMAGRPGAYLMLRNHNSAAALVENILKYALAKNGYRVVDSEGEAETTLEAYIKKLWTDLDYGLASTEMFCVIDVNVFADHGEETDNFAINAKETMTTFTYFSDEDFSEVTNKAIRSFENNAVAALGRI